MHDREERRPGMGTGDRTRPARRLKPGKTYFDMDHPERSPFVATGDEDVEPGANIVAEEDVDIETWRLMIAGGWGGSTGSGSAAEDQGAFGRQRDPRSDVINAGPPGVGEGLTPKESEEENRHR